MKKWFIALLIMLYGSVALGADLDVDGDSNDALDLVYGGTNTALTDPGADTLLGWDDTDGGGAIWFTIGAGLTYTHATHTLSASGSGDVTGVGDCADGACLDGSSDGGTYIRLYDGDSHYTQFSPGNSSANLTWTFPTAYPAGTYLVSSTNGGVLGTVDPASYQTDMGITGKTDSTSTTSSTVVASATAVKAAYDLADGKQSPDTELSSIAGLTFVDASIIQLTGAGASDVLTSGGNNYILGSTSDNSALEFKTPANTLTAIGGLASAGTDNIKNTHIDWGSGAGQVDMDDVPDSATYQKVAASDVDASSHVNLIQDVDGTGAFTFTGSSATRAITVPTDAAFTIVDLNTSQTLTTKIIDADDNTLQDMPHDLNISIIPNDSYENLMVKRFQRAVTFSAIGCMVDPADSDESVVLDIYECDSNGDNCAASITQVTCLNTPTAATVNDGAFDANDFMKITLGTITGTVSSLIIYGTGKETW